jgi:hypothetical protein
MLESLEERALLSASVWSGFGGDAQHTAMSALASQPILSIRWQTPVDLQPQHNPPPNGELFIHYGEPVITSGNTVIIPVKTGATDGFELRAVKGTKGGLKYTLSTDYTIAGLDYDWTPSFSPALTPSGRLYYAGAGGTLYYIDNPDSVTPHAPIQVAFYGLSTYQANPSAFNSSIFIDTPLTSDSQGDIFFGFRVQTRAPAPLNTTQSGYARIDPNGNGTYVLAGTAAGDTRIINDSHNLAPALSNDQSTLYVAVRGGTSYYGYLLGLDSTTLATKDKVFLNDPRPLSGGGFNPAGILDNSTASPTIGPDGDVYFGVFGNPYNGSRGWLLHFSSDLSVEKTPGAFGWDDTASIVPASMVPSYHGTSSYLLFTKYNNYAGTTDGGDGVNKIAILDPNATETEPHASSNGLLVMKEVMTIAGPTPDGDFRSQGFLNAVREWCINSAVVDPATKSVLANSEDGKLYRWDLTNNTFTGSVTLTQGIGEAYTPTLIGADGTIYAINNAILFAVGRGATTTSAVSSSLNPAPLGQPVTFTATVISATSTSLKPTGAVMFLDGRTSLGAGQLDSTGTARFATAGLSYGAHVINAVYMGDSNFDGSKSLSAFTETIGQFPTATAVKASVNPSVFGQPITFFATVRTVPPGGTPTGNVAFFDGNVLLGTGPLVNRVAQLTTLSLDTGNHIITASYIAANNFLGSTSPIWGQGVRQDSTRTILDSSANPSIFGQPITFVATVFANAPGNGSATGTVTFRDGNVVLGTVPIVANSEAFFTVFNLPVGSHPMSAFYSGDRHFIASVSAVSVQVVDPRPSAALAGLATAPHVGAASGIAARSQDSLMSVAATHASPAADLARIDDLFALVAVRAHRGAIPGAKVPIAQLEEDWLAPVF